MKELHQQHSQYCQHCKHVCNGFQGSYRLFFINVGYFTSRICVGARIGVSTSTTLCASLCVGATSLGASLIGTSLSTSLSTSTSLTASASLSSSLSSSLRATSICASLCGGSRARIGGSGAFVDFNSVLTRRQPTWLKDRIALIYGTIVVIINTIAELEAGQKASTKLTAQ